MTYMKGGQMKPTVTDLINKAQRVRDESSDTKMDQMQPLNEIRTPVIQSDMVDEESGDYQDGYTDICNICQIYKITDSCKRCGLYQYGKMFDIMIRRRQ